MRKKLIYLTVVVLVLVLTGNASAELVAYWPFDEGLGTALNDIIGGNNGSLQGDPTWIVGPSGGALEFDGNEDLVTIPNSPALQLRGTGQYTVAVWVYVVDTSGGLILFSGQGCVAWANWYLGVTCGEPDASNLGGPPRQEGSLVFGVRTANGAPVASYVVAPFVPETWMHVAATYNGTTLRIYIDGQEVDSAGGAPLPYDQTNMPLNIAGDNGCSDIGRNWFTGKVDELQIHDEALTQTEIQDLMRPSGAWNPSPTDRDTHVSINPTLSWEPGRSAETHNVYFGTTLAEVAAATPTNHPNVQVSLGQSTNSYTPPGPLEYGQTYYWRVDEIDAVTVWTGAVWSFIVQPLKAFSPTPVDEAKYLDLDTVLTWQAGFGAQSHDVYLGTDPDNLTLESAAQTTTTYEPEALNYDTTYYWRVDEFDGTNTYTGDLWSFSVLPDIAITEPNLVGWWKFDEGSGTRAVDWSGHDRHGTIYGGPIWIEGYDDSALEFDGVNNYVDLPIDSLIPSLNSCTITTWVDFSNAGGPWQRIFGFFNPDGFTDYMTLMPRSAEDGPLTFAIVTDFASPYPGNETYILEAPSTLASGWHHVAVVIDGDSRYMQLYLDGAVVAEGETETIPSELNGVTSNILGGIIYGLDAYYSGLLDDFRIYDKALTQEEVDLVMKIDPLRARYPNPVHGATIIIVDFTGLSWSPGDNVSQHQIYFGTDKFAVENADTSTTGIYRGQQAGTSFSPSEGIEWGQTYYWRIDEMNNDGTISTGNVWTFTVADYLIVENFEDYNDYEFDRIFDKWIDGYNITTNGSTIGYAEPDFAVGEHFVETTIVHGGYQSMPYFYDNTVAGNSEATLTLVDPTDWTDEGVEVLSLWFQGYPPYLGSFTEDPAGTFTMTATGTDIWDTSDEFHFAYKQLTGVGSITARVRSVDNTDPWAKAGVMLRNTLEPDSRHASIFITPGQGVSFQRRSAQMGASTETTESGIEAPQWVRIERTLAGDFIASYSANGSTWTQLGNDSINMDATVYVGVALTSHNTEEVCEAVFSNVTIEGNVSQDPWMDEDIGILSNGPEPMYVVLDENAVVYHEDPNTSTINEWTEWRIDLQQFADQGIDLTNVESIGIGFGDRANPQPGGAGLVFFDDIRLYRPSLQEPTP
ncbi:MAG: hypothetical protein PVH77_05220 [Phycisphaerales bacterium]|jgi:hypothetical protein